MAGKDKVYLVSTKSAANFMSANLPTCVALLPANVLSGERTIPGGGGKGR